MRIRLSASAVEDLEEGSTFYENQAQGLGGYFADTLLSDIESLTLYAGIHSIHWGCLRLLSSRFPYAIYYQIDNDEIKIWRVLDCRQNPSQIRRSLEHP